MQACSTESCVTVHAGAERREKFSPLDHHLRRAAPDFVMQSSLHPRSTLQSGGAYNKGRGGPVGLRRTSSTVDLFWSDS
jgi:hypothetical protein